MLLLHFHKSLFLQVLWPASHAGNTGSNPVRAPNCYVSLNRRYRFCAFRGEDDEADFVRGPGQVIDAQSDEVASFFVGYACTDAASGSASVMAPNRGLVTIL